MKEALDHQKSYVDTKQTPREFLVGDKVFLCVKLHKRSIKFGKAALN